MLGLDLRFLVEVFLQLLLVVGLGLCSLLLHFIELLLICLLTLRFGLAQFIFSGALVGLLVGLTGVGGGSLMTPILTLIFGVAPTTAVGTDLAFAALTKGIGTAAHRLHGNVKWPIVGLLCSWSG